MGKKLIDRLTKRQLAILQQPAPFNGHRDYDAERQLVRLGLIYRKRTNEHIPLYTYTEQGLAVLRELDERAKAVEEN